MLHCNDANCAGGDESIQTVDSAGWVGENISMALDVSGFPVVGYRDNTNGDLKVLHCNDANCAGGDESIQAVDTAAFVGVTPSLVFDSSGFPVVSYYDFTNYDLKVLHCNDPNCAGGDESIQVVDAAGDVGVSPSIALDASGHPVVGYYDTTNRDLKVLHCNDANCAGGDESIESVDTGGDSATGAGAYTSLALDASGYPVVSYWDATNGDLKVLHCGTAACNPSTGANTDDTPLDNGPLAPGDDITILNGDTVEDWGDTDDDNDGLADTVEEAFPIPGCPSATSSVNPREMDTDGDHLTDGWECFYGIDPADPISKYLGGADPTDGDGDRVPDLWEKRGYNASGLSTDSDGDACHDLVEIASIDGNKTVGDADRLSVARRALNIWPPEANQDYVLDIDKNGTVGDSDRLFVARAALLPDWLPKSCP